MAAIFRLRLATSGLMLAQKEPWRREYYNRKRISRAERRVTSNPVISAGHRVMEADPRSAR
jgi:hypothetical protein